MTTCLNPSKGNHYNKIELGPLDRLRDSFSESILPPEVDPKRAAISKVFTGDALESQSLELSVHHMLPGQGMPFWHRHKRNEEVYVILKGRGRFLLDDQEIQVKEGDVLRVDPSVARTWCADASDSMVYMCVQVDQGSLQGKTRSDGERVERNLPW